MLLRNPIAMLGAALALLAMLGCSGLRRNASPPPPAPLSPSARPLSEHELPAGVRFPGAFVAALAWEDVLGTNVLVVSESTRFRHEPGVIWSPTAFVTYTITQYAGTDTLMLWGRDEHHVICSHPRREHRTRTPKVSDVDGDGIAEVVGVLDVRCGQESSSLLWALEGGVDLFRRPPEGAFACGGGGRLDPSVRGTPFERHMRRMWLHVSGQLGDDVPQVASTVLSKAREAFQSTPPPRDAIAGDLEQGLRWTDAAGEHAFVLSRRSIAAQGTIELYATLLRNRPSGWDVVQRVRDGTQGCTDSDNVTRFLSGALDLTDLDGDGVYEVTFAYKRDCMSDVGPVRVRLLLLEGRARYEVRGNTWVGRFAPRCMPPDALVFADDPIERLLDTLDPDRWQW